MAPTPPRASDTKGKASVTGRRGANVQKGPPPDRRILRTQERLREAVVVSILEKGWEATSVADVCERADVARSTFYLHYADKEDLLLSGFDHLEDHLIALSRGRGELAFLEPLFEHAHSHERLFRAMAGRQSGRQIEWRFMDLVGSLFERELTARGVPKPRRPFLRSFLSGATVEVLLAWLDRPGRLGASAVADQVRKAAVILMAAEARRAT